MSDELFMGLNSEKLADAINQVRLNGASIKLGDIRITPIYKRKRDKKPAAGMGSPELTEAIKNKYAPASEQVETPIGEELDGGNDAGQEHPETEN